jgi:hypothetical protein
VHRAAEIKAGATPAVGGSTPSKNGSPDKR